MIRVAIIGCGTIGSTHSRALRAIRKAELADAAVVVTCDEDRERATAFAAHHGAEAVTDPEGALAEVDAVWICTPTASHLGLLEAAARRGVHVFCEKPLATSLADAHRMLEVAEAAGIAHQVGLVLRSAPPFETLAAVVSSGEIGDPLAAVFRDDQYFPIEGQYRSTWRSDVAIAGGGTLIEHSIHDIDVLAWTLGPITEVTARTANFAGHPGVEDVAVATFTHGSGATSSLVSVWHSIMTRPSTRRLEVIGQRGLVWLDNDRRGPVHIVHDESPRTIGPDWPPPAHLTDLEATRGLDPYLRAALRFLGDIQAGRRAHPGLEVAVAAHEVADAAYRSAALGGAPLAIPERVVALGGLREDGLA